MTVQQFNEKGFEINDLIQVRMNNGEIKSIQLHTATAYQGRGEYQNYSTKEIIPASKARILYIDLKKPNGLPASIDLEQVESVQKINPDDR